MITNIRRKQASKIIQKRVKQLEQADYIDDKTLKQPNRLNKQHKFGCKVSNCKICRNNKR